MPSPREAWRCLSEHCQCDEDGRDQPQHRPVDGLRVEPRRVRHDAVDRRELLEVTADERERTQRTQDETRLQEAGQRGPPPRQRPARVAPALAEAEGAERPHRSGRVRVRSGGRVHAQSLATKGLARVPIWSISISQRCPAVIGPTPAGVPVRMTSPGSSVNARLA